MTYRRSYRGTGVPKSSSLSGTFLPAPHSHPLEETHHLPYWAPPLARPTLWQAFELHAVWRALCGINVEKKEVVHKNWLRVTAKMREIVLV